MKMDSFFTMTTDSWSCLFAMECRGTRCEYNNFAQIINKYTGNNEITLCLFMFSQSVSSKNTSLDNHDVNASFHGISYGEF